MRRIPLAIVNEPEIPPMRALLTEVLKLSPNRPIGVDEMRQRVTALEALDRASDELLLEDATWNVLCEAIRNFPFSRASRSLLDMIDAVLNAKQVDLNEH